MLGQTLGHYRVVEKIGAGGMGEVYRAEDTKLGRDVALKVLSERLTHDATRLARFEREARVLASLNHPNIAAIYGFEEANGQRFLVLELVEGEDLAQRLKRGTPPLEETLEVARQICDALEAAHERGVIHRDLKPANVKVTPAGKVKVLDFGLAKAISGDSEARDFSQSPTISEIISREGVILGTAAYMSPEQARGKPLDKRTDLWSFGCLLYELLTARGPFDADTVSDCIGAILHREPDWALLPPETPPRVRHLLRRCLEKDAARRLRDIGDARLELEDALEKPTLEMPAAGLDFAPVPRWRRAVPWALAGLLGVSLLLALVLLRRTALPPPVTRFTIQLPPTEPLSTWRTAVALSPDGSRLVYTASRGGIPLLFLRHMDKLEAAPLADTEGASGPFFSPDGERVGFLVGRTFKSVSLRDGAVSTIGRAPPVGCGAAWAPDNSILYSFAVGIEGLYRFPAGGGEGKPLTRLDASRGELSHCWPEVLPGGSSLVFTVLTEKGLEGARIVAARLDSSEEIKEWKTVVEGGTHARYSPTGHLVYASGGKLLAVPFDPERLETTGPATPLDTDVLVNPSTGSAQFALSPAGALVLVTGGMQTPQRTLVWVDRQGRAEPVGAPARGYGVLRLSPDRRLLAMNISNGNEDIWVYDLARGTLSRVTSHPARDIYPVWTRDGQQLIFSSDRNRRPQDMYRKAVGGGNEEALLTRPTDQPKSFPEFAFDTSPDRRWLIYAADNTLEKQSGWDLFLLPLQGERTPQPFLGTQFDEIQPAFSPDSRWLAYASNETGRWEIYVLPYPGPGPRAQISTDGGLQPLWSPSGRELFYRNGDQMMAVEISAPPAFSASAPRQLFEGRYVQGGMNPGWANYDVSADGQRFLLLRSEQEGGPTQMTVVLNWLDELRWLAPSK